MNLRLLFTSGYILYSFCLWAQVPTASFTAQTTGCAPAVISFQDQSSGSPTGWQWNFGNGATSTQRNPSTAYFSPGTYTVTLTVSNASGSNTLTRSGYISIYSKPVVNFSSVDTVGCAPFRTKFTDASSPGAGTGNINWQWDFGNGTQSSLQNPAVNFTNTGAYNISLRVTSDKGCAATYTKSAYVQVNGSLNISFTNTLVNRCQAPFPVSFTNTSTGPGTLSYFWNFGDGVTSTLQNTPHTYAAPGNYTVALAVTSSNGCTDTLRKTNLFTIPKITTSFTSPDSICTYAPVNFKNTSVPVAQSTVWNFGDGSSSSAYNPTPAKAFNAPGTYTVQLQQDYGTCTDFFSKTIKILPQPVAQFSGNNTIKCSPPLTVQFTDASVNAISWKWLFGDGFTSTQQNPSHIYTAYGNYDVTLIVTNRFGCTDTMRLPAYIKINNPVIRFPSLPEEGCIPYTTTLTPKLILDDNVTWYAWDFGDGGTSSAATPSYTWLAQGKYTVGLTITTSTGCTERYSLANAIIVGRIPVIDFTVSPNPMCAFGTAQFTGIANEADKWQWDFGDGGLATMQNPLHQYNDTGNFTVTFVATNSGCSKTLKKTAFIKVNPPIANFTFTNDCIDRKRFLFKDSSTGATSWRWDFGDGSAQSTLQNPVHTYPNYGSYVVTLTVMNDTCSNTKTMTITVFDERPSFTASIREVCKQAVITFTPVSNKISNIRFFNWDFGIMTLIDQFPRVTYSTAGSYNVTLVTEDIYGCKDTASENNFIRINGPVANFSFANNNGCKGLKPLFTSTAQLDGIHPIAFWKWQYGDGSTQFFSSPTPPRHSYTDSGSYTVKLTVTDIAGCKDSIEIPKLVNVSNPKIDFTETDALSCLGSTINFTNKTVADNFTSTWDFGDGNTAAGTNASYIYKDTGAYTIQLKIRDGFGCVDSLSKVKYIKIRRTIADFTVSDSIGICTPFEASFTNQSQFYQSSFWQLGNGNSSVTNPVQLYNTKGVYAIKLIVTGRGGCVDSISKNIQVFDASTSTFTYSPFAGCNPLPVSFSSTSPGQVNHFWDFGDGEAYSTSSFDTLHIYKTFGNFVPKLILSDFSNCVIPFVGKDTIRIVGAVPKFGWDKNFFCDSGTVKFTESSTFNDPITSYNWSFGDGTNSSVFSPVHSYASPGWYTVYLALQTQQSCRDTFVKKQLIKIVASPSISIGGDTAICKNNFLQHTGIFNLIDTSVVQWAWQFPNGKAANIQFPASQLYGTTGRFTIQAIATNSSGCTDTAIKNLIVRPLPIISLASPQTTLVGTPVLLPATYSTGVINYAWQPPTGLSCTTCPQPMAKPKFTTLYTVTATDSNGCKNISRVQVIVLCQAANVFIPNSFSPNNDGNNDIFYVRGKGLARVKSLRIFNRWGEVIFDRVNFAVNDSSFGWDGTFKGKKLPPETYIYQADIFCENSETVRIDGSIALLQ